MQVLLLFFLPLSLAAAVTPHQRLVQLAADGNGNIKLNDQIFDLLLSPTRTWSASVHLTAMDGRRRCAPCKSVP